MGQEAEQQRRREDFGHLQVNDRLLALAPATARVIPKAAEASTEAR